MKMLRFYAAVLTISVLFPINSAHAIQLIAAVSARVKDINNDIFTYNYELLTYCFGDFANNCSDPAAVELSNEYNNANNFYVPYFSDAGITGISAPSGWSYSIESTNDLFSLGSGAGVIHWSASVGNELSLDVPLSGFIYTSTFAGSVKAPFRIEYAAGGTWEGDPPIPASPSALAAGLVPISAVPVPASIWLFCSGLLGLFSLRRSRS